MTVDISDDPETQLLRDKWTVRGVPSSLFDEMVTEANAEYNSTIGYEDYNRFTMLTVNIEDNDETEDCLYVYVLSNYGLVLFGNEETGVSRTFGQVPNVNIHVQVFKVKNDYSSIHAYGETTLLHTKDETVNVELTAVETLYIPNVGYGGSISAGSNYTAKATLFNQDVNMMEQGVAGATGKEAYAMFTVVCDRGSGFYLTVDGETKAFTQAWSNTNTTGLYINTLIYHFTLTKDTEYALQLKNNLGATQVIGIGFFWFIAPHQ